MQNMKTGRDKDSVSLLVGSDVWWPLALRLKHEKSVLGKEVLRNIIAPKKV